MKMKHRIHQVTFRYAQHQGHVNTDKFAAIALHKKACHFGMAGFLDT